MARKKRRGEAHVRLYRHELECEAWKTMNCYGRALVVEARSLYRPAEGNRIFLSIREIKKRLNIGQKAAMRTRDEVVERGFLRLLEQASFDRKVRHAPAYALTSEPLDPTKDGAVAPKDFMKWRPPEKNTVPKGVPIGTQRRTEAAQKRPKKALTVPKGVPSTPKIPDSRYPKAYTDSVTTAPPKKKGGPHG